MVVDTTPLQIAMAEFKMITGRQYIDGFNKGKVKCLIRPELHDPRFKVRGDEHPHKLYSDTSACKRDKDHPGQHFNGSLWWA